MLRSRKILLLDDRFELAFLENYHGPEYEAVIAFFWMAPSTQEYLSHKIQGPCYGLPDLICDEETWGRKAYDLIRQIIHSGPCYRHLAWRSYLAEPLYEEAHTVHLLLQTAQWIARLKEKWSVSQVVIEGTLPANISLLFAHILSGYSGLIYRPWALSSGKGEDGVPLRRKFRERLREALLTGGWRKQWADMREWMDPTYRGRIFCRKEKRRGMIRQGGITFFSSYQNNSQILSSFAGWMSEPVTWILTNDSARRGISCDSPSYVWLWAYGGSSRPNLKIRDEGISPAEGKGSRSVSLLRYWLAQSFTWKKWQSVELPLLATLTACWEEYLDQTKPGLIVMANQWGIEGWFTNIARDRGVPVLQIMHGALGGHLYTQTPILSNALVVSGNFWRDLWSENERARILVCNPEGWIQRNPKRPSVGRRCLTFFSWPLSQARFYSFHELVDGFIHIFHKLVESKKYAINIRFHPRENPGDFVQRWRDLYGHFPSEIRLHKNEPLSKTLAETDVALLFRSTVMLNCMTSGIPSVLPGWIDFGWNRALQNSEGMYLAHDFPDLEKKVREWLDQPPCLEKDFVNHFVDLPGAGKTAFYSWVKRLSNHLQESDGRVGQYTFFGESLT